jgi:hypothetical protein
MRPRRTRILRQEDLEVGKLYSIEGSDWSSYLYIETLENKMWGLTDFLIRFLRSDGTIIYLSPGSLQSRYVTKMGP